MAGGKRERTEVTKNVRSWGKMLGLKGSKRDLSKLSGEGKMDSKTSIKAQE